MVKLSIITINYNNKDGLLKTLESVAGQTDTSFEYVLVDGGSTDGSKEVIERHHSLFSRAVCEPDSGIYNAMNKGVRMSTGEYLLFLNSGDSLADKNVVKRINGAEIVSDIATGITCFYDNDRYWMPPAYEPTISFFLKKSLSHQATLIRRTLLLAIPYDEKKRIVSDWKFCIEALVLKNCTFQALDTVISRYDVHGISATPAYFGQGAREREETLNELFPPRLLTDIRRTVRPNTRIDRFFISVYLGHGLLYRLLYPVIWTYCRLFNRTLLE